MNAKLTNQNNYTHQHTCTQFCYMHTGTHTFVNNPTKGKENSFDWLYDNFYIDLYYLLLKLPESSYLDNF